MIKVERLMTSTSFNVVRIVVVVVVVVVVFSSSGKDISCFSTSTLLLFFS